jgi:hypothetical protein
MWREGRKIKLFSHNRVHSKNYYYYYVRWNQEEAEASKKCFTFFLMFLNFFPPLLLHFNNFSLSLTHSLTRECISFVGSLVFNNLWHFYSECFAQDFISPQMNQQRFRSFILGWIKSSTKCVCLGGRWD